MALVNPSALYTGGKASLSPVPYMHLAMQSRMRKQAREDAIDKYFQNLPNTINDKGVRDIDIEPLNQAKNDIMEYAVQNSDALRNNGAARFNLEKKFRDAQALAQMSKNAAADDIRISKIWDDPNNRWLLSNEDFINQHKLSSLPVNDPNYKRIEIDKLLQQQPFDEGNYAKILQSLFKYNQVQKREKDPNNPDYDIISYTPELSKENKQILFNFSADKFHNDPRFQRKVNELSKDPKTMDMLSQHFQDVYGAPMDINVPEQIAASYSSHILPVPAPFKSTSEQSVASKNAEREKLVKMRSGFGDPNFGVGNLLFNYNNYAGENVDLPTKQDWMGRVSETRPARVVYLDKIDVKHKDLISEEDKNPAMSIPQPDGSIRKAYEVLPNGDWKGIKGIISAARVQDDYVNKYPTTKVKTELGTKAAVSLPNKMLQNKTVDKNNPLGLRLK